MSPKFSHISIIELLIMEYIQTFLQSRTTLNIVLWQQVCASRKADLTKWRIQLNYQELFTLAQELPHYLFGKNGKQNKICGLTIDSSLYAKCWPTSLWWIVNTVDSNNGGKCLCNELQLIKENLFQTLFLSCGMPNSSTVSFLFYCCWLWWS